MKEDILEQLVDEYLQHLGYFTRHNLKFRPSKEHRDYERKADAVASDIDVIGIHPRKRGKARVVVVSCKSWQGGFNPEDWCKAIANDEKRGGREAWRGFRELTQAKWAEAFRGEIEAVSGSKTFTYITAVTKLAPKADRAYWENHPLFRKNLKGNPVKILTFSEMLDALWPLMSNTPAASQIGRMLQLMKASGWKIP